MADDPTKYAIDVIARRVIADASCKAGADDWGDYADIGETDWMAVEARINVLVLANNPSHEHYDAAYEYLSQRAEGQES